MKLQVNNAGNFEARVNQMTIATTIRPGPNYLDSVLWVLICQAFPLKDISNVISSIFISFLATSIHLTLGFPHPF